MLFICFEGNKLGNKYQINIKKSQAGIKKEDEKQKMSKCGYAPFEFKKYYQGNKGSKI